MKKKRSNLRNTRTKTVFSSDPIVDAVCNQDFPVFVILELNFQDFVGVLDRFVDIADLEIPMGHPSKLPTNQESFISLSNFLG